MIAIELSKPLEKHLRNVVQENYGGDMQIAIKVFLKLHEKYGWQEQFLEDVKAIRLEVRRRGGVKVKTIDAAINKYRNNMALQIKSCPTCGSKRIKLVCKDITRTFKGQTYTAPSIEYYECPACGEHVYDREAMRKIESYSPAFAHKRAASKKSLEKAA